MPNVGGVFYRRIEGLPTCGVLSCRKHVERRGGSIFSAYCLEHARDEMHRLVTTGLSWSQARARLWQERPLVRLTFVP